MATLPPTAALLPPDRWREVLAAFLADPTLQPEHAFGPDLRHAVHEPCIVGESSRRAERDATERLTAAASRSQCPGSLPLANPM
jgi:hypothetical protein